MQDILFSKYANDKDYIGNLFTIELLGFISSKEVKIDKYIIMEPFIPNIFDRRIIKESTKNFNETYLYLEPILNQFHISFHFFYFFLQKINADIIFYLIFLIFMKTF